MPNDFSAWTELANRLADVAGAESRKYFRQPLDVIAKGDASPVTIADRDAEAAMRQLIKETAPDHGIFGEEHGVENIDAKHVWVLDPIDGTAAFITGLPTFGNLISLAENGAPVLGVINQPISGERWSGVTGQGARFNGQPIKTRDCGGLSNAAMFITTPEMLTTEAELETFSRLRQAVRLTRYGGDCYSYGLLASGHADLVFESDLKPYDFMALVPVVEEAGGIMSDWQGNPLTLSSGPQVIAAANKRLHEEALELINR
ncbi:histidinol-phosphatase [Aestuariispira insulae]|uniref:Histidinol-phosphatase n=1 Tax=Aestuariispira insulae TaxID=1461337 RepID=A0A3D9HY06_9PROT|nr:histidinol-phosphatase [Aestuariispira insulae]RED54251.1 myo-inositol-1(or 4)-monophosphatase/inositol-phosphate phosphatase/L-galactose 1-phosphate phosphatase/histidinol-phosphatase [Aestuariispira insulae]